MAAEAEARINKLDQEARSRASSGENNGLGGHGRNAGRLAVVMRVTLGMNLVVISALGMRFAMRTPVAAGLGAGAERFVQNLADRAGAAAALRAASKAAIHLVG